MKVKFLPNSDESLLKYLNARTIISFFLFTAHFFGALWQTMRLDLRLWLFSEPGSMQLVIALTNKLMDAIAETQKLGKTRYQRSFIAVHLFIFLFASPLAAIRISCFIFFPPNNNNKPALGGWMFFFYFFFVFLFCFAVAGEFDLSAVTIRRPRRWKWIIPAIRSW